VPGNSEPNLVLKVWLVFVFLRVIKVAARFSLLQPGL
jgi:hypothetical protein